MRRSGTPASSTYTFRQKPFDAVRLSPACPREETILSDYLVINMPNISFRLMFLRTVVWRFLL